jgi:hypothetical protein
MAAIVTNAWVGASSEYATETLPVTSAAIPARIIKALIIMTSIPVDREVSKMLRSSL